MTDADVAKIQRALAAGGRACSAWNVRIYLAAKEVQKKEPTNGHAKDVIDRFNEFLNGQPLRPTFSEFAFDDSTDEEIAEENESRDAYIAARRLDGVPA